METKILITGGAGFFGHHLVEHLMKNTSFDIVVVDNLNYSGNLDRLRDIDLSDGLAMFPNDRISFFSWDFTVPAEPNLVKELSDVTHVIHNGGLTHVDTSISDPESYVKANVLGTTHVLQFARQLPNLELFHFVDTDEVYGPAPFGSQGFSEKDRLAPKNPYAATKAGAGLMVEAFANTYKLPCVITNMMNLFGERQHPEKFIPLCINAALQGKEVTVHSNPEKTKAGTRTYIHCRNAADAFSFIYKNNLWMKQDVREVERFNIVGEMEVDNLELAKTISMFVQRVDPEAPGIKAYNMVDFHSSRPGHDLRYALDGGKLKNFGWTPPNTFHESLLKCVEWYMAPGNKRWLNS